MIKPIGRVVLTFIFFMVSVHAFANSFESDSDIPIVELRAVIPFGSAYDPKDKLGLANATAEMLLRGTTRKSKNMIFAELDRLGANIDVETQIEGTIFKISFLSENADKTFKVLQEIFTKPGWISQEFEKLKKELVGELLAEKANDMKFASKQFAKFLFEGHPYGHPSKGTEAGINNIHLEDVKDFFHAYYGKEFTLFGTGDLASEKVLPWWNFIVSSLEKNAAPSKRIEFGPPKITINKRLLLINKAESTQSQIFIGGPAPRPDHSQFDALSIANYVYGGPTFNARLMKEVRVKRGWTYGINSRVSVGRYPKYWVTYLFPKTEDTVNALNLTLSLFKDFIEKGITKEEFQFAQSSLVNSGPFSFDTSKKRMDNLTLEFLFDLPKGYFENQYKRYSNVSYSQANESLKELLDPNNLTILIMGDAKKLHLDPKKIPTIKRFDLKPYQED